MCIVVNGKTRSVPLNILSSVCYKIPCTFINILSTVFSSPSLKASTLKSASPYLQTCPIVMAWILFTIHYSYSTVLTCPIWRAVTKMSIMNIITPPSILTWAEYFTLIVVLACVSNIPRLTSAGETSRNIKTINRRSICTWTR